MFEGLGFWEFEGLGFREFGLGFEEFEGLALWPVWVWSFLLLKRFRVSELQKCVTWGIRLFSGFRSFESTSRFLVGKGGMGFLGTTIRGP